MKNRKSIMKLLTLALLVYLGYEIGGPIGFLVVLAWWLVSELK